MNELFSAVADSIPRVAAFGAIAGVGTLLAAWLCSIAWVLKDARSRTAAPALQAALVAPVVAGGLAGLPIYLAVRPLERRSDARAADRYLEVLLERVEENGRYCACGSVTRPDWVYCPSCSMALQSRCGECGAHGPKSWAACAYCGAEHGGPAATPLLLPAPAAQRGTASPARTAGANAAAPASPSAVAARAEVTA